MDQSKFMGSLFNWFDVRFFTPKVFSICTTYFQKLISYYNNIATTLSGVSRGAMTANAQPLFIILCKKSPS